MVKSNTSQVVQEMLEKGRGIFQLEPTWVPRTFVAPGRRLKLAVQDLYALGKERGGIDERWFGSTTPALNEGAPPDEGLSYIAAGQGRVTLRDAIAAEGNHVLGKEVMQKWGGWKVYAKYFDNAGPIPQHVHHRDEHAKLVGSEGKPEAYYFPPQLNVIEQTFPLSFFGLHPGTKKDDIVRCLKDWNKGDNGILNHSPAYRLQPGIGWFIPAGTFHAPGTYVTYEVQWASDVMSFYQSLVGGTSISWNLVVKDIPKEQQNNLEFIVGLADWEANVDPGFKQKHFLAPVPVKEDMGKGISDKWVIYCSERAGDLFSAKELTISPGKKLVLKEKGAFCATIVTGHGRFGCFEAESPVSIRYGERTRDEFFVTASAAREGIEIENKSGETMVVLRYFGPDTNPDAPKIKA